MTQWTDKQLNVINTRDRNILVSAAAGSGKTAVLVERIIRLITDKTAPVDIDQLLVVTFTKAAASEMKERVRNTLEEMVANNPQDSNLRKQLSLIHSAHISTIDSFCGKVVRENFEKIDIDPNYRIADTSEVNMLKTDILDELLEEKYAEGNEDFENLVEQYSKGKLSDNIGKLILTLYGHAMAQEDPKKWINNCMDVYEVSNVKQLKQASWLVEFTEEMKAQLRCIVKELNDIEPISESEDGPKFGKHIENFLDTFNGILNCEDYDAMRKHAQSFAMKGNMTASGKNLEKKAICKAVLEEAKEYAFYLKDTFFVRTLDEMLNEIILSKRSVKTIVELTLEFMNRLEESFVEKGFIDFSTQEHMALKVLKNSDVAAQMSKQYKEIMIDEYQDSNYIQEAILSSIANGFGINNMFMVGDVKQSIYRFRKAEPKLFLNKYDSYSEDLTSDNCKIILDKNFRSRREVVNSVNFIFDFIMYKEVGGIDYKDGNQLVQKAEYVDVPNNQDDSTEIVAIEGDSKAIEAEYVAAKIKELTDPESGMKVMGKDKSLRPLQYRDVVILLRAVKGNGQIYMDALENYGVPAYAETDGGYFDAMEINTIISLLQIIDNPRQDIPLATVLLSPMFDFTENQLAVIKSANHGDCLFERINLFDINENDEILGNKIREFLNTLNRFRKISQYSSVYDLINIILKETGFDYYIAAMPQGKRRILNIEMLKEKAVAYDSISYKGLFNFVRYIDKVKFLSGDEGEASTVNESDNVVRIMSIHKSKGLQFPVVFLSNTNPLHGEKTRTSEIAINDKGIIAVDAIDTKLRTKNETLLKEYVNKDNLKEEKAEDLRLIYVALTRAQEKLFVTGIIRSHEKEVQSLKSYQRACGEFMSYMDLTTKKSYWYWISRAMARNKALDLGIGEDIDYSISKEDYKVNADITFKIAYKEDVLLNALTESVASVDREQIVEELKSYSITKKDREILEGNFNFVYPYEAEINLQSKASVTEIKKQSMAYEEEQDGKLMFEDELESVPIIPNFAKEDEDNRLFGAKRGTAYHRVFELLDMTKEKYTYDDIKSMLDDFVKTGAMSNAEADCIYIKDIIKFTESKLFSRMRQAHIRGELFREKKFLLTIPVNEIKEDTKSEEPMIIQGIIDVCFIEDGKYVIADYKTDRVTKLQDLVDRYKIQLECYEIAIKQISGFDVSEKIIYSVTLGDEISL